MPTIQMTVPLPNKQPSDCFQAALQALPKVGFDVWKTRDSAYLALARQSTPQGDVDCHLMVFPGVGANLTMACDNMDETTLHPYAKQVSDALLNSLD